MDSAEAQGLLEGQTHGDGDEHHPQGGSPPGSSYSAAADRTSKKSVAALLALALLVNLSMTLYQLPVNRVIERRLCREYYASPDPSALEPDGDVPEQMCKIDEVQKDLAWIQGAMETAWIVGDFVMTIPLGFVADRYGHKFVLWLNMVPRMLMLVWAVTVGFFDEALPTRAIVASPALSVLGGDCVFNSIVYALAAGMTSDHVLRASYLAYLSSVWYVVNLLGPALASATMSLLLWTPFLLAMCLLCLAAVTIHMLPSQQHHPFQQASASLSSSFSITDPTPTDGLDQPLLSSPVLKAQRNGDQLRVAEAVMARLRALLATVTNHPRNFTLLLASFFLTSLASSDTKLLAQYISKRYGWSFAAAGFLLSGKAVVNLVLLTTVVPAVLRRARRRRLGKDPAQHTGDVLVPSEGGDRLNVRFAKLCLGVSILGALAIAAAGEVWFLVPSLLLYALGSALPVFTLSLLKSPAVSPPPHPAAGSETSGSPSETHVFSIVMLVKTLGSLVGAPLMAVVWVWGIGLSGWWLGLPYLVSGACYGLAMGVFRGIVVG